MLFKTTFKLCLNRLKVKTPPMSVSTFRRFNNHGKSNHLFSSSSGETSADWDKAWSAFKKKGKRTLFSDFSPDKYVTWNHGAASIHCQKRSIQSS